jgi:methionine aminotransferase
MKLTSKLPDLSLTIFSEMTQLAEAHGAINLSQGFPDYAVPEELRALVAKYMHQGRNQYAPMLGVPYLREQIAAKVSELYGAAYDPASEITVTSGATEALFAAITAVVRPGDEVVVLEPAYDSYAPVISLCGGIPVYVQMGFPGYRIAWQDLREALSEKTRAIILNSPHNPSGAVLTPEDISSLIQIVQDSDIVIISDEVYEHIVFDGFTHQSMARYPELAERSFVLSSFGKT